MPIFTRETLRSDRLPWMEIDDFEFFVLGRPPFARPNAQHVQWPHAVLGPRS